MTDESSERRSSHLMETLKQYWGLILFALTIVGTIITMWFKLDFVVHALNPDTVIQYRTEQAIMRTKQEARWCLTKALASDQLDRDTIFKCGD